MGVKSKDTLIGSSEVCLATYLPGACGFLPAFAFCIELSPFAAQAEQSLLPFEVLRELKEEGKKPKK